MLKEQMNTKEPVLGTMISEFPDPNLLRIFKVGGYQYVIVDGEHGPFTSDELAKMIAIGNSIGLPVIVRIPEISRPFITRTLDMGAEGFLVPMVNTKEQAEELVKYSKYSPLGKRGVSLTRSHTDYNPPKLTDYMKEANEKTVLLVQIETKEAVSNVDEIASVEGLDALIVGPSDLSTDLGIPGELSDERLIEAAGKVASAAAGHGLLSGTVSGNYEYLHKCHDMGMTLFCVGSELSTLVKGAKANVNKFNEEFR